MAFGSLATIKPTALNTNEVLYTAPTGQLVEGKVYITNRSASEIKIRVGLSTGTVSDFDTTKGYVVFNREIPRGEYYETDRIYFGNGESVVPDGFKGLINSRYKDKHGRLILKQIVDIVSGMRMPEVIGAYATKLFKVYMKKDF